DSIPGLRACSASRNSSSSNSPSIVASCGSRVSVTRASAASSTLWTRRGSPALASDLGIADSLEGAVGIAGARPVVPEYLHAGRGTANVGRGPVGQEQRDDVVAEAPPQCGG